MKDNKNKNNKHSFLTRGFIEPPQVLRDNSMCFKYSCAKLNVYDYLCDMPKPTNKVENSKKIDYYEVRFKNSSKGIYCFCDGNISFKIGDIVAVEATPGHDIGIISATGVIAEKQMCKKCVSQDSEQIKKIYRKIRNNDIEKWINAVNREEPVAEATRQIIKDLNLDMKLNDVEFQGDGTKATFYYTAEDRVDFRRLIKILAEKFRVRIEMKQIGIRQEASRIGGIGSCGRELCCATWITKFTSVSTVTARVQQLTLNPVKLAGQCGKLKCCLNFEYEAYLDALKDFPDNDIILQTRTGDAQYVKSDVFKRLMWYSYTHENDNAMMALPVDKVKNIIKMNKKGKKPKNIEDFALQREQKVEIDEDVVTPDDLARFDD